MKNSPDTFYFSVAAKTTLNGHFFKTEIADPITHPMLIPTANFVGDYSNDAILGDSNKWKANDGVVPVISAKGDASGYIDFPLNLGESGDNILKRNGGQVQKPVRGQFMATGVLKGTDHWKIVAQRDPFGGMMDKMFKKIGVVLSSLPPGII